MKVDWSGFIWIRFAYTMQIKSLTGSWGWISYRGVLMSLELNDSSHISLRSGCLVNFVSEVKEKINHL